MGKRAPNEQQVLSAPGQAKNVYLDGWAKTWPAGLSCEQYWRFRAHMVCIKTILFLLLYLPPLLSFTPHPHALPTLHTLIWCSHTNACEHMYRQTHLHHVELSDHLAWCFWFPKNPASTKILCFHFLLPIHQLSGHIRITTCKCHMFIGPSPL